MAAKKTGGVGYSGTPLPAKLGIQEGAAVVLVGAPVGFEATLGDLPVGVRIRREGNGTAEAHGNGEAKGEVDVAVVFATERAAMNADFAAMTARMTPAGGVWIAWPKKASGVATDITEDAIREDLLPTGWVDNKVCAIDETWSGLRLVLRKELRPKGR